MTPAVNTGTALGAKGVRAAILGGPTSRTGPPRVPVAVGASAPIQASPPSLQPRPPRFDWLTRLPARSLFLSSGSRKRRTAFGRSTPTLQVELLEGRLVPAMSANFQVVNDWGSGFQGAINIVNDQAVSIPNWTLEFDFAPEITQVWNGVLAGHTGTHYVITNAGWNSTIAPN